MSSVFFSREADEKQTATRRIVACIDNSEHAAQIVSHAYALADALRLPVTLLHVLEATSAFSVRPDPIEWSLRRHEAQSMLSELAKEPRPLAEAASVHLAEGPAVEEIIRFTRGNQHNLLVLGTEGENGSGRHCIGATVRNVLDHATDSILLVPATAKTASPRYGRVIVPLDGSCWAESVIPIALRVVHAARAELVLVHIVPSPELTEPLPLEPEDMELRCRVIERNERIAHDYFDRLRKRLSGQGLQIKVVIKRGDNVRCALANIVDKDAPDLLIMSARGHGSRQNSDFRYGGVTSYMMTHATMPVLIFRPDAALQSSETAAISNHHLMRAPAVWSA